MHRLSEQMKKFDLVTELVCIDNRINSAGIKMNTDTEKHQWHKARLELAILKMLVKRRERNEKNG